MGRNAAGVVVLDEQQRAHLESFAASRSLSHALVVRAKIVLMACENKQNVEIARELGVSRQTVAQWRKRFAEQGVQGLYDEYRSGRSRSISDEQIAELISQTLQSKPQGSTHWSCRSMAEKTGISKSTVQRVWTDFGLQPHRQRHFKLSNDANSLSEEEVAGILAVATSVRFRDLAVSQIVPILAEEGLYVASESSFYRVLRQEKLLKHREPYRGRRHSRPQEHKASGPNQVWSWDITYLRAAIRGQFYYLYLVVDIWSRMIVAWQIAERECEQISSRMIAEACMRHGVKPEQLVLHSDNGGPMKGATLVATLQFLGIVPSFSRPHVSADNPYSESLFRTLKYRPQHPAAAFESLAQAEGWVREFVNWYNTKHRHSAIKFVTPAVRHAGQEHQLLARRKEVYEEAKKNNPARWSGATRNWQPIGEVSLNSVSRKYRQADEPQRQTA